MEASEIIDKVASKIIEKLGSEVKEDIKAKNRELYEGRKVDNEVDLRIKSFEQCMVKKMMVDSSYTAMVVSQFEPEYFKSLGMDTIFKFIKRSFLEYGELPQELSIINSCSDVKEMEYVQKFFKDLKENDYDVMRNNDQFLDETRRALRTRSYLEALSIAHETYKKNEYFLSDDILYGMKELTDKAYCKDINVDLGVEYGTTFYDRVSNIGEADKKKTRTYFSELDEYLDGGFEGYNLGIIAATIHGGKSNLMVNISARQYLEGKNIVYFTMEMKTSVLLKRFDSIYSKMDINRVHRNSSMKKRLLEMAPVINNNKVGNIYVKEYTEDVSVIDFEKYLRELKMRNIDVDIIYVDYLAIMNPVGKVTKNLYQDGKKTAEDLRKLSGRIDIPIIAAVQLNVDGSKNDLDSLDHNYIAESRAITATADFVICLGNSKRLRSYDNEIHYKIVKNRLGGVDGVVKKFFIDRRSLKMYCGSEEMVWLSDAEISGDSRNQIVK